jgi:hypothetical protein
MPNSFDSLAEEIKIIVSSHNKRNKVLFLGSYAKNENKFYINDSKLISLSDVEFLILGYPNKCLTQELSSINNKYKLIFGEFFSIDYNYVYPSLRILLLKNRLLFFEGYKNSNYKIWQFEYVVNKKFDLNECIQSIIWRLFAVNKKCEDLKNNNQLLTYFIARNILDLYMVFSYCEGHRITKHQDRVDFLKDNDVFNSWFDKNEMLNVYQLFDKPDDISFDLGLKDFSKVYNSLLLYLKAGDFKILPSKLTFFKQILITLNFKSLPSLFYNDTSVYNSLERIIKSDFNKNNLRIFVSKFKNTFIYLNNYNNI